MDSHIRAVWQTQMAAAKQTPGLLPQLVQRRDELLPRFAAAYRQLRTLPRRVRRHLQRHWRQSLAGIALALALGQGGAYADTINVDGTTCTLINAIVTANTDVNTGGCVQRPSATAGADTIVLQPSSVHTLTAVNNRAFGETGLPVIRSEIIIEGHGSTIHRDSGAPRFRILAVNDTGNLTLKETTISGGALPDSWGFIYEYGGGGILNYAGTVTLERSTVSGNSGSYGGGIFNYVYAFSTGTVTLINSTVSGNSARYEGGGVVNYTAYYGANAVLTLTNSTVSGNSAVNGGGVVNYAAYGESTLTLIRSLISGNTASTGAEVSNRRYLYYGQYYGTAIVTANNHNLFGHSGLTNTQAVFGFTPGATDLTATADGTTPTALKAILRPTLTNNGGPTKTHALVPGSPTIDASPDDADCAATDQRGVPRPQGPACDIGAVERYDLPTFVAACGTTEPTTGRTVNGVPNQLCIGTPGDDVIIGTKGNDVIFGLGGNDLIKGGEGDDCIDGGPGNDQMEGQDGNDVLFGRGGDDKVRGGTGDDLIVTGRGKDTVRGDEGNDLIYDTQGKNTLEGQAGDDLIWAPGTTGTIDGGSGTDECIGGITQVNCP
jgi:Ca2+-binding RTX toxin-like protein